MHEVVGVKPVDKDILFHNSIYTPASEVQIYLFLFSH